MGRDFRCNIRIDEGRMIEEVVGYIYVLIVPQLFFPKF